MLRFYKINDLTNVKTNYSKFVIFLKRETLEDTEMQSNENCHKSTLIIRGILAHSDIYKVLPYDRPCEQKDEDPFFFKYSNPKQDFLCEVTKLKTSKFECFTSAFQKIY